MRLFPFVPLGLALLLAHSPAFSKTIVCINDDGTSDIRTAEGHYRSLLTIPPDEVHLGGSLTDCLDRAANGDRVIIIAHGLPGGFIWDGTAYGGFGPGTGAGVAPHPVPTGFGTRQNLKIRIVSCFSAADPDSTDTENDGPQISVTSSMDSVFATGSGSTCSGFLFNSQPGWEVVIQGATSDSQYQAMLDTLQSQDAWQSEPPESRPGANPNQRTAALAILQQFFPNKQINLNILYPDILDAPAPAPRASPSGVIGPDGTTACVVQPYLIGAPFSVPLASPQVLMMIAAGLGLAAWAALGRRARAGPRA